MILKIIKFPLSLLLPDGKQEKPFQLTIKADKIVDGTSVLRLSQIQIHIFLMLIPN